MAHLSLRPIPALRKRGFAFCVKLCAIFDHFLAISPWDIELVCIILRSVVATVRDSTKQSVEAMSTVSHRSTLDDNRGAVYRLGWPYERKAGWGVYIRCFPSDGGSTDRHAASTTPGDSRESQIFHRVQNALCVQVMQRSSLLTEAPLLYKECERIADQGRP